MGNMMAGWRFCRVSFVFNSLMELFAILVEENIASLPVMYWFLFG